MKLNLSFIVLLNLCFSTAIFSELNQNSIYFSLNNYIDNITKQNIDGIDEEFRSNLYKINFGYVLRGRYDFSLSLIENNSNVNNYYFYKSDIYLGFGIGACFKNLNKIPVNFKLDLDLIGSNSYDSSSLRFYVFKEFAGGGNYPVIPFLEISKTNYSYNASSFNSSYSSLSVGYHLRLNVESSNNSVLKDLIWISSHINTTDFSHYFIGFNVGLYHPIK